MSHETPFSQQILMNSKHVHILSKIIVRLFTGLCNNLTILWYKGQNVGWGHLLLEAFGRMSYNFLWLHNIFPFHNDHRQDDILVDSMMTMELWQAPTNSKAKAWRRWKRNSQKHDLISLMNSFFMKWREVSPAIQSW